MQYHIDVVLCIDCTSSMRPVINEAKVQALNFHEHLYEYMNRIQKDASQLRVKVIGFRDIYHDGDQAMLESPFFTMPQQRSDFQAFISTLEAKGGGPIPESSLEALSLAMRSAWSREGESRRHAIVVWTDAPSHKLEDRAEKSAMVKIDQTNFDANFDDLTDYWEERMDQRAKRLVLFAPNMDHRNAQNWAEMKSWSHMMWFPSAAGQGLTDRPYTEIIRQIAQSIEGGQ